MKIGHVLTALVVTCAVFSCSHVGAFRLSNPFESLREAISVYKDRVLEMKRIISDLSRQVMLQQYYVEERTRSDGDSGVKTVRGVNKGLNNYDGDSHISSAFLAIHDHSNYDRTIGMGEVIAVLNGLEFRTRHNDYKVVMPSTTSGEYDAVENIPYPQPPEEVTKLADVHDQIMEMREWFHAFWTQNTTHRDYTKYFRPVLCYMEGGWTLDEEIVESFASDRHSLDASSWFELQEKNRFSSASGMKDRFENVAYLPTTILDVNETSGFSTYAQWNYRILCYPIQGDIPFEYIQQVEDLSSRVSLGYTRPEVLERRTARYKLYRGSHPEAYNLLDELMYTIPGKDNFYTDLTQASFDESIMYDMGYPTENIKLDTSRYHRWYKSAEEDAMGLTAAARCYNDENCFVSQTTQPRVAPIAIEQCGRKCDDCSKTCEMVHNAFTYAIPMEIIFLTPLLTWNPYNLPIHEGLGIVDHDDRNGGDTLEKAYDGIDSDHYYMTPVEFFSGDLKSGSPADTVKNYVYVKDSEDNLYKTTASGHKIMLPDIDGVGRVRLRYPIAPVHGEGSAVWKEVNALRDSIQESIDGPPRAVSFEMASSEDHYHEFTVSYNEFLKLINDRLLLEVWSDESMGHRHYLEMKYNSGEKGFKYTLCDGLDKCFDGHARDIYLTTNNVYTELP